MWNAAVHSEFLHDHADYGFDITSWSFNFKKIKEARDAYIARLHGIYNSNLEKDHVEKIVSGISIYILSISISDISFIADWNCKVCRP